jgi:hypothetical protein
LKTSNDDNDFGGSGGGNAVLPASVLKTLAILENGPPTVNLSLKKLEEIAKKNGVASEDLGLLFTYVFSQVVYDAVSKEGEDVTDLIEVVDFAEDIGLTPQEIGDGFSLAAIKVGQQLEKDNRGFFVPEYSQDVFLQATKIFFLGDKMIGNQNGYYGKRLSVALHFFTPESLKEQVTSACTNLFRRCVESVVSNPNNFSLEEVENLRQFLTPSASASSLRPANMQSYVIYINQCMSKPIFITISPVPLSGYVGANHVFTANTISKANLVLSLEEAKKSADFTYIPIYELIMLIAPVVMTDNIWGDKNTRRHPNEDLVKKICEVFINLFNKDN